MRKVARGSELMEQGGRCYLCVVNALCPQVFSAIVLQACFSISLFLPPSSPLFPRMQVSQLQVENGSLASRLSEIGRKYNEAAVDNRVLKSDVEALRAKVGWGGEGGRKGGHCPLSEKCGGNASVHVFGECTR